MGWMELLVVGVVALIVVGPKDLPVMFQSLGKMMAKVKRMAREFQTAMSDAANATGAADISKDLKGLTSAKSLGIDKLKDAADAFDKWEPTKDTPKRGPETETLSKERAAAAEKIRTKTAEVAQARLNREAAEAAKAEAPAKPAKLKSKPAAKTATKPKAKPAAKPKPKPASSAKAKPAAKPRAKPATKSPDGAKA